MTPSIRKTIPKKMKSTHMIEDHPTAVFGFSSLCTKTIMPPKNPTMENTTPKK